MVTAGLKGLGAAITAALAKRDYRVVATTRDPSRRPAPAADRGRIEVARWDTQDPETDAALVHDTLGRFGRLDVLVLNAGPYHAEPLRVADTPDEVFRAMLDGNLTASFRLLREALPALRQSGRGRVITMGYVGAGAATGWPDRGAYAAAKSGLAALTRTLAAEERMYGVTVNMICPSDIRSKDKGRHAPGLDRPVGGDVARLVAFLADPAQSHVTGQVMELAFPVGGSAVDAGIAMPVPARARPVGAEVRPRGWSRAGRIRNARLAGSRWEYEVEAGELRAWVTEEALGPPGVPEE